MPETQTTTRGQVEFPCKQCGAKLKFAPGTTSLVCEYCGAANEIHPDARAEQVSELDYSAALADLANATETDDKIVAHCNSCGADVSMPENVTSQNCPFCGTPIVATGSTRKIIRPKSVAPFVIADSKARDLFRSWLASLWFAPSDVKKSAAVDGRLSGFYIPFWTYDARAETDYTGQRGDDYWETQVYTTTENGRPVTRTRQVRRTRWRSVSGHVSNRFDDVLVVGSVSLPPDKIRALGDWNLAALTPYQDEFLSGFQSESYTIDLPTGFSAAQEIMLDGIRITIRRDIGGDHQIINSMDPEFSGITFKHVLLPIWIASYRYRDKVYRFLVNGQTGTVTGDRPWSVAKITLFILFWLLVIAIVVLVLAARNR